MFLYLPKPQDLELLVCSTGLDLPNICTKILYQIPTCIQVTQQESNFVFDSLQLCLQQRKKKEIKHICQFLDKLHKLYTWNMFLEIN